MMRLITVGSKDVCKAAFMAYCNVLTHNKSTRPTEETNNKYIRQRWRWNNTIHRLNMAVISGTVFRLRFRVWKNPKGFTSPKKTPR